MSFNYPQKIIALWVVFLLATLFHTQLGLMPLFHGISIAPDSPDSATTVARVLWLMLLFFMLPLLSILAIAFNQGRQVRVVHFWLTVVYSVLNFLHLFMDLQLVPIVWSQITLMFFLFAIGLWLNLVSYQWWRDRSSHRSKRLASNIDSYS